MTEYLIKSNLFISVICFDDDNDVPICDAAAAAIFFNMFLFMMIMMMFPLTCFYLS